MPCIPQFNCVSIPEFELGLELDSAGELTPPLIITLGRYKVPAPSSLLPKGCSIRFAQYWRRVSNVDPRVYHSFLFSFFAHFVGRGPRVDLTGPLTGFD